MKGSFSRFTFDRSKHFSGVLLQQGRVQLDADWNEQLDIAAHLRRSAIVDLLGPAGAPEVGGGFDVTVSAGAIRVSPGRFWVDGLLVENDEQVTINSQPHPPATVPDTPTDAFLSGLYVGYLDAWERHVTAIEDPDLLEPALGGPDTATRREAIWQLRLQKLDSEDVGCEDLVDFDPRAGEAAPTLAARSVGAADENRLIRVEVHRPSGEDDPPTFKWSRDNGAVAARIETPSQLQIVIIDRIDQDEANGFAAGQWVEVTDEARIMRGEPGVFARLASVAGQTLTVEAWPDDGLAPDLGDNAIVRRWDSDRDVPVPGDDAFLALEGGLEVRFGDGFYRTGDYWLIPVRAGVGAVWPLEPTGEPRAQTPHGIEHRFAPLALLRLDLVAGEDTFGWSLIGSCRTIFRPASERGDRKVSVIGDTMTGPLLIDDARLTVRTGGETAFHVTDTGRVGVGTADPQAALEIRGGALMPAAGDGEEAGILFPPDAFGGSGDRAWIRYISRGGENTTLQIGTTNDPGSVTGDHITLKPFGNVGIGVDVPQAMLDIDGGIHVTRQGGPILYNDGNATGTPANDGFRMRWQTNFFASSGDALVIEKTDGNSNDPDGGIAFVNTGKDGNVETALTIRGSGNVGIATLNPTAPLEVAGGIRVTAGAGGVFLYNDPNAEGAPGTDGFRLRREESFFGTNRDVVMFEKTDRNQNDPDGGFAFVNTGKDAEVETAMVIRGNNRVGIRMKQPSRALDVDGTVRADDFDENSDVRWKRDIACLEGCLDQVERLRGVRFAWRRDEFPERHFRAGTRIGLIAQEVEAVIPELVRTDEDGYKSLAYGNLVAVLVEAVKEISTRLRTVEASVTPSDPAAESAS